MPFTADYYVDPVGGNDGNAGTSTGAPWLTLQKAADTAVAGKTVGYKFGTETLSAQVDFDTNAGTPANRIYMVGLDSSWEDTGARPTITAGGSVATILARTVSHVVFRNFKFTNNTGSMITGSSMIWYFDNCEFSSSAGVVFSDSSYSIIKRCDFLNNVGNQMSGDESLCTKSYFSGNSATLWISCSEGGFTDNVCHDGFNLLYQSGRSMIMVGNTVDSYTGHGHYYASYNSCTINNRFTNFTGNAVITATSDIRGIYENNFFYNPSGTDVSGADLLDGGDNRLTADNTSDGYTDQPNDDFTLTVGGEGVGVSTPIGDELEATNIAFLTQGGLPPEYVIAGAPTFAGITGFEVLSNGRFKVSWDAATAGTVTRYNVYIRNATSVFNLSYLSASVDNLLTSTIIELEGDQASFLTNGTLYYCGVRADNSGTEDSNVVELTNICSGSDGVQMMTNTVVSL